jgi:hypothetical protein
MIKEHGAEKLRIAAQLRKCTSQVCHLANISPMLKVVIHESNQVFNTMQPSNINVQETVQRSLSLPRHQQIKCI